MDLSKIKRIVAEQRADRLAQAEVPSGDLASLPQEPYTIEYSHEGDRERDDAFVVGFNAGDDTPGLRATVSMAAMNEAEREQREPRSGWWALDVLGSHLAADPGDPDWRWAPHVIGNALPTLTEILTPPAERRELPTAASIARTLNRGDGAVLITGPGGSGKSTQVQILAANYHDRGDGLGRAGLISLNLTDPHDGPESVMQALLVLPRYKWFLLIVENIHANPPQARAVLDFARRLRREAGLKISVLATGSVDYERHRDTKLAFLAEHDVLVVRSHPKPVFDRMMARHNLDADRLRIVKRLCGDGQDLVLAQYVQEFLADHDGRPPTPDEFVVHVASKLKLDELVSPGLRRALYHFTCLGMYEIDVPRSHPETLLRDHVDGLLKAGLIERSDTSYQALSKSVARLVTRYAYMKWCVELSLELPWDLAARYLQHADQIKATLNRNSLINSGEVSERTSKIMDAWSQREELARRLKRQVRDDPEWQRNAASAAFAAMALAQFDMVDSWSSCAEFVRGSWNYGTGADLPVWKGEVTQEADDFLRIQRYVKQEDEERERANASVGAGQTPWPMWPLRLRGDNIDITTAHRTWMTGVLLGFEALAPEAKQDVDRLRALSHAAENAQEPSGAFYPSRIPWITARILMGLCEAGFHDSPVARRAAAWLCNPYRAGESQLSWNSGTGTWNSNSMTRAMCVIALQKHDAASSAEAVERGYADLVAGIAENSSPSEIEKALYAEAFLLSPEPGHHEIAFDYLRELIAWLRVDESWLPADQQTPRSSLVNASRRDASEDAESTKLAFVAFQVAVCIWRMVTNELSTLLRDLEQSAEFQTCLATAPAPDPVPAESAEPDPTAVRPPETSLVPLPDADLVRTAAERLSRIFREITRNIESREEALRGRRSDRSRKPIEVQQDLWLRRQNEYHHLAAQWSAGPITFALIEQLDQFGQTVMGAAWRRLRSPDA